MPTAIIQARMGATRLPNKMLLHLHGYPIIEWVYRRVSQSKRLDKVIFALPDTEQDDLLAWYLKSIGAMVFRGSEVDLVDRYYKVAKSLNILSNVKSVYINIKFEKKSSNHIIKCISEIFKRKIVKKNELVLITYVGFPNDNYMNVLQTHYVRDLI